MLLFPVVCMLKCFFFNMVLKGLLETFRFKDDYEHEI